MDTGHSLLKDPIVPVLHSKAATPISVVMTPPSLDLPNHVHCFIDDLTQPLSNTNSSANSHSYNETTKSIEFNDYSSIINNKNRKNFSSLLIKNLLVEETTAVGDVLLNTNDEQDRDKIAMEVIGKYEKLDWKNQQVVTKKAKKLGKYYKYITLLFRFLLFKVILSYVIILQNV